MSLTQNEKQAFRELLTERINAKINGLEEANRVACDKIRQFARSKVVQETGLKAAIVAFEAAEAAQHKAQAKTNAARNTLVNLIKQIDPKITYVPDYRVDGIAQELVDRLAFAHLEAGLEGTKWGREIIALRKLVNTVDEKIILATSSKQLKGLMVMVNEKLGIKPDELEAELLAQ